MLYPMKSTENRSRQNRLPDLYVTLAIISHGVRVETCNCLRLSRIETMKDGKTSDTPTRDAQRFWKSMHACMLGWSRDEIVRTAKFVAFSRNGAEQGEYFTAASELQPPKYSPTHAKGVANPLVEAQARPTLDHNGWEKTFAECSERSQQHVGDQYHPATSKRMKQKTSGTFFSGSDSDDIPRMQKELISLTAMKGCDQLDIMKTGYDVEECSSFLIMANPGFHSTVEGSKGKQQKVFASSIRDSICCKFSEIQADKTTVHSVTGIEDSSKHLSPVLSANLTGKTLRALHSPEVSRNPKKVKCSEEGVPLKMHSSEERGNENVGSRKASKRDAREMTSSRKTFPLIGLTGIAKAKLEQAHNCSNAALEWESLRLRYLQPDTGKGQGKSGTSVTDNGVNWAAVREANVEEIAGVIKARGNNYVLAGRIKAFLDRVKNEHGSLDLQWLKVVPPEKAKLSN